MFSDTVSLIQILPKHCLFLSHHMQAKETERDCMATDTEASGRENCHKHITEVQIVIMFLNANLILIG